MRFLSGELATGESFFIIQLIFAQVFIPTGLGIAASILVLRKKRMGMYLMLASPIVYFMLPIIQSIDTRLLYNQSFWLAAIYNPYAYPYWSFWPLFYSPPIIVMLALALKGWKSVRKQTSAAVSF